MTCLASLYRQASPEITMVISPHSQLSADKFLINSADYLQGSFEQFGHAEIQQAYQGAPDEVKELVGLLKTKYVPVTSYQEPDIDHGILVPLSFLETNKVSKSLLPLSYSFGSIDEHLAFGRCLFDYCQASPQRISLIASGDLSHRLFKGAPAGYSPNGKEFDEQIIGFVEKRNYPAVTSLDSNFIEDAGECGYRSLCILMGALETKPDIPKVLSYEGPFGVGYAVINFPIHE